MAVVSAAARDLAMVAGRGQVSSATPGPGGGTGRRAGLRSPCPQGREGPNPSWGTLGHVGKRPNGKGLAWRGGPERLYWGSPAKRETHSRPWVRIPPSPLLSTRSLLELEL